MEMSDYVRQLDYEARKRYCSKLEIDGGKFPDPYSIQEDQWIDDAEKWPDLEYGDIYNYLIDMPGPYTKENLKAYKSLEAYNFFYSGHIRTFCTTKLAPQVVMFSFRQRSILVKNQPATMGIDEDKVA